MRQGRGASVCLQDRVTLVHHTADIVLVVLIHIAVHEG